MISSVWNKLNEKAKLSISKSKINSYLSWNELETREKNKIEQYSKGY